MTSAKIITQIQGVDVSDYRVVELSRENLISAGFEKCPKNHRHMLIHAVQFQLPVPSPASMKRTEKRNKIKADQKVGGQENFAFIPKPRKQAMRKIKGSHKRRAPSSLPPSVSNFVKPKTVTNAIKVRSPEWNTLKAAREACEAKIETWFGKDQSQSESSQTPIVRRGAREQRKGKGDSEFPIYFQKRHRSHKRRMRERWELIKANLGKLVELYGDEILKPECRISIQDLKKALGLVDDGKMEVEGVGEFMAMINQNDESQSSSNYHK